MDDRRTLMVVHAHPDDEVFSTGGILARYAAAGDRVVVVYGTRGEVGEMYHPELDPEEAMERLGEIREQEAREANALLGVSDVRFLGYRDSGMADTDHNQNPAAFANASLDEAVERLLAIMRETQPQVMVTYDQNGGYGHPDHIMTNRVATEAFRRAQGQPWAPRKLYYAASSREEFRRWVDGLKELGLKIPWVDDESRLDEWGTPEADITAFVDIAPYAPLKKRALAVHRTQIKPDFFYLTVPDEALSRFAGREFFIRVEPPAQPGEHEDDLFAGVPQPVA